MDTKKIMAIFALLVVSLSMVGYAYATWWKYLYIEGYVNTGWMNAEWTVGTGYDSEQPYPLKDPYSYITGWIDPAYPDVLNVYLYHGYPCIDYYLPIDIENTGTIPIHVYFGLYDWNLPVGTVLEVIADPAHVGELQLTSTGYVQLHPGDAAYGLLHVHLPENTVPDTVDYYYFQYYAYVVQWNEP
jgi:hypothetical protein